MQNFSSSSHTLPHCSFPWVTHLLILWCFRLEDDNHASVIPILILSIISSVACWLLHVKLSLSLDSLFFFTAIMPIIQDKRVSMGLNGDLFFSNVLAKDANTDYSCNARFEFTHTIQQKNPYTLKVLTSEWWFLQDHLLSLIWCNWYVAVLLSKVYVNIVVHLVVRR